MKSKRQKPRRSLSKAKLDEMIRGSHRGRLWDSEQIMGFFCLLEERLQLPFNTEVLGSKSRSRVST